MTMAATFVKGKETEKFEKFNTTEQAVQGTGFSPYLFQHCHHLE